MRTVIALPGAERLAANLARELACDWSALQVHRFPDGESLVRIDAPVRGRSVVFAGTLDHPDAKIVPLLFAADAARELGAARIGLVAPYLPYMRQDARFRPGEAVSSRSFARLLSASLDFLVTVDPHLHRWNDLRQIFTILPRAVSAMPAMAQWIRTHVSLPLLVGPDSESEQWVAEAARLLDAPFIVLRKTREGDEDVRIELQNEGQWPGRTPVLLDDIVSTGGTLAQAAGVLQAAGCEAPVCVAVHALIDPHALQRLEAAGIARFVSCNTIDHPTNAIDVAPLLGEALRQLNLP